MELTINRELVKNLAIGMGLVTAISVMLFMWVGMCWMIFAVGLDLVDSQLYVEGYLILAGILPMAALAPRVIFIITWRRFEHQEEGSNDK